MKRNGFSLFLVLLLLSVLPACSPNNVSDTEESFQPELEAYSMPWAMPLLAHAPYHFHDNHLISVVFKSETEVLNELVPPPLIPNPEGQMFFYIGQLNPELQVNDAYSYLEAGIGIPVTFEGNPGNYYTVMYLDKAFPIVGGREVWGFPKKDAEIVYEETEDKIFAQVTRLGTVIAELSASLGEEIQPIPEDAPVDFFNFKIIPSVRKGAPPDVMQLTSYTRKVKTFSLRTASQISLKFGSTGEDPLGEIPVLDIVDASFKIQNTVLDYGEILYDYLQPSISPDTQ